MRLRRPARTILGTLGIICLIAVMAIAANPLGVRGHGTIRPRGAPPKATGSDTWAKDAAWFQPIIYLSASGNPPIHPPPTQTEPPASLTTAPAPPIAPH